MTDRTPGQPDSVQLTCNNFNIPGSNNPTYRACPGLIYLILIHLLLTEKHSFNVVEQTSDNYLLLIFFGKYLLYFTLFYLFLLAIRNM